MASIPLCSILLFTVIFWSAPLHGEEELPTGLTLLGQDNYDVVAQKNSKLLLNCSVSTNTTKYGSLNVAWYKDGIKLELKDNRIQLVQNGSLYFKRVLNRKKKNVTDEGLYECHVTNNIGSIIARRVKVKVKGIAKSYIQEPQPQTVVAGGVARFQCHIKAEPPALYTWLKDQKEQITANNRFIIIPSGILQILDVRKADEGFYSCSTTPGGLHNLPDQVEHIEWKPSAEVKLTVIDDTKPRPPVIIAPPKNVGVENGQSAILECLVDGNPKPKVVWERSDGKPISDRSSVTGGNLKLLEVTSPSDTAVYICRASSPGNKDVTAKAKLTVQTRPVITNPPTNAKYPAARLVRFTCKTGGIPKPKIKWLKDGRPIKDFPRYSKTDGDALIIPGSTVQDSGYYQCIAYNSVGYATSIVRLEIVAEGNRPGPPKNVRIVNLTKDFLKVEWDPSEAKPCCAVLAYSVDIMETNGGEQRSFVVQGRTQKEIDNLEPFTNYFVFVRAYSDTGGASEKSRGVTVVTKEDVPEIPPMIRLASTTPNSISVKWEEIEERKRNGIIQGYQIYYMREGDKKKKFDEAKGTATSHMITGLEPDTVYKVRVMASTSAGYPHFNEKEWPWVEYKTPSTGKLPSAPIDLHIVPINMTAVNVTWSQRTIGNPAVGFMLIIRKMVEQGDQRFINITDPRTSVYTVTNLENNTFYEISLVARNDHGSSGPVIVEYLTSDEPLPAKPQNLRVTNVTSSALYLTWTQPNSSVPVQLYEVRVSQWKWTSSGILEYQPTIFKKTPIQEIWIRELTPYTDYKLEVRALSRSGHQSVWSRSYTENTLEDLPSEPRELNAFLTTKGIRVEWKPPAKPNGNITKYIVMYQVLERQPNMEDWKMLKVNGSLTSAIIDGQKGMYRIRLKACTRIGPGPPSSDFTIQGIFPTEPPGAQGSLEDQKLGIILGVTIGVVCIIICIIIVTLRNKCFSNGYPHTQPARFHGNGHIPGRGNGHATHVGEGLNDYQLEICTPMLSSLPGENEHSDSKGCGSGNIIVTPNGTRVNGYVPFKNGMRNGHISNGHVTAYISYSDPKQSDETRGLIAAMLAASDGSHTSEEPTVLTKTPDRDSLLDGIDRSLEETEEEKSDNTSQVQHLPPNSTRNETEHGISEGQSMEMAERQPNQYTSQQKSASSELFTHSAHSVAAAANTGHEGQHQGLQEANASYSLSSPQMSSLRTPHVSCVNQLSTSDCKHCHRADDPQSDQGKPEPPEEGTPSQSQAKPQNLSENAVCPNRSHQPVQQKNLKKHKNQESSRRGKKNGVTSHYKAAPEREKPHLNHDPQGELSYYYNGRCYQQPPPPPYPHKIRMAPQSSQLPQECNDSSCWHAGSESV